MNNNKAFCFSKAILGEVVNAYGVFSSPFPVACIRTGIELIKGFNSIADFLVKKYDKDVEKERRINELKERIARERVECEKEIQIINNEYELNKIRDEHYRNAANRTADTLKAISDLLNDYDIDDKQLQEFKRCTIRVYKKIITERI